MPGTLTALTFKRSANGDVTFIRSAPTYVDARDLAANTNETHTVPAGAETVMFSCTGDFYAKQNGAAAIPGDVTDGSASELNPKNWSLEATTSIGLIAPAACKITLTFSKLKNS